MAEDKRFFEHGGSDWIARFYAMWQNIQALRVVRDASTISEQTVRDIQLLFINGNFLNKSIIGIKKLPI